MKNFYHLLNLLTVDELKTRIPLLKKGLKPTRKAEIIKYIYDDCVQNHKLYWGKLTELEKDVVAETLHQHVNDDEEYVFNSQRFSAKYGQLPKYFSLTGWEYRRSPAKSYLALFLFNKVMPTEYQQWMKSYIKKPKAISIPTITEDQIPQFSNLEGADGEKVAIKLLYMEEVAAKDLESVLRFIETGLCAVSDKTNRATAATIKKLDNILLGGDYFLPEDDWGLNKWCGSTITPIRSFAWPLLLQASGLAKRLGKKLQLTSKGKKALSAPLHKTIKTLYQRWRNKSLLDEFSRIDEIKGQASKGRVMSAVAPRKKAIESILQQCPVDQWIGIDSLFQYIKATGINFSITHDEWRLYITDREYGALGYSGFGTFEVLEGRYILAYFFEYLATLGLLDIAYTLPYHARNDFQHIWGTDDLFHLSRYDGLMYFRINPLGEYCLDIKDSYQLKVIQKPTLLKIHDDLSIHILRQPSPAEFMMLERYAKKVAADIWRMTDIDILSAMESSFPANDFKYFLQENSNQDDLDECIEGFFTAANEREHALEDKGGARLMQGYSKGFVKMLVNSAETKKYCDHVTGTMIVIPEKTKKQFMKGLHKLGYVYPQE